MRRMQKGLAQISIGREEEKSGCVLIEPSYGIQTGIAVGGNEVCNAWATLGVAHGRNIARRLIEHEVRSASNKRHGATVDLHLIDKRVDFSAHFCFHFSVDGNPASSHQAFGTATACYARTRQKTLQAHGDKAFIFCKATHRRPHSSCSQSLSRRHRLLQDR